MENRFERIRIVKEGEWWIVQIAVDGVPCIPFEVHEYTRRSFFPNDTDFEKFLERKAEDMIALYGDARHSKQQQAA